MVAAITPRNSLLHQIVAKVVPALAADCTMVLKPSEVHPALTSGSWVLWAAAAAQRLTVPWADRHTIEA